MNRVSLVSGVSATAAIAAAVLAGCSSGATGTASASGSRTPSSARATPSTDAAGSGTGTGTSSSGTGSSSPGSSGTGSGTASSTECQTSQLSLQVLQGPQDSTTSNSFYIQLTNESSKACTLYGFPGVELIGGVGGTPAPLGMKDDWMVKLSTSGTRKVQTLTPSSPSSAAFVTYSTRSPGASADIPRAEEVQVIPPNQRTALTARIDNVDAGYITPLITSKTLDVGPMDIDGVPHK